MIKYFYNEIISYIKSWLQMTPSDFRDTIGAYIIDTYKDRVTVTHAATTFSHYYAIACGNIGSSSVTIRISDHYQNIAEEIKDINIIIPKSDSRHLIVSVKKAQPIIMTVKQFKSFLGHYVYIEDANNFKGGITLNDDRLINDFRDTSIGVALKERKAVKEYDKIPLFIESDVFTAGNICSNWKEFIEWYSANVFDFEYSNMTGDEKTAFYGIFSTLRKHRDAVAVNEAQQIISMTLSQYAGDSYLSFFNNCIEQIDEMADKKKKEGKKILLNVSL